PSGGFDGEEASGYGLQDRRSRRRQREIVGRGGPQRGGNGRRLAARPARGGSDQNGHEGGGRQSRGISHARVALLQIRSLRPRIANAEGESRRQRWRRFPSGRLA